MFDTPKLEHFMHCTCIEGLLLCTMKKGRYKQELTALSSLDVCSHRLPSRDIIADSIETDMCVTVKTNVCKKELTAFLVHVVCSHSLPSRDIIADSIETVMCGQWYDANISLPGCDKNMPGVVMAMARFNRPSIMVYGGTIKPGCSKIDGRDLVVSMTFESYGE